jgi:hypothetical protein
VLELAITVVMIVVEPVNPGRQPLGMLSSQRRGAIKIEVAVLDHASATIELKECQIVSKNIAELRIRGLDAGQLACVVCMMQLVNPQNPNKVPNWYWNA